MSDSTDNTVPREPERYEKSDRPAQRRNRAVRLIVLAAGLVIITVIGLAHRFGVQVVGVDALCPFGGIETFWTLVTQATLVQRVAASSVVLLVAVLLTAVVFRRSFCGYVCPLGALQEFFGKLGALLWRGKRRPAIPAAIDRPARWLKYVVLAVFAVWSWQAASLVIRPYDPWVAYMHLTSTEVLTEFWVGLIVLGVSVAGSVVYERFFCKYLCPMGGFLGAISRFSVFKVRRNELTCTDCKACDKVCPVNVKVSQSCVVDDPECINCNECVNVCPVKGTLEVAAPGVPERRRILQPLTMLGIVVAIIVAVVGLTTVSGSFAWTLPSLASAPKSAAGTLDVSQIRGSMSFEEVSKATGIPASAFEQRFGVTEADMGTPMKDLAESHGFDVHTDVRDFVSEKLGSAPATP